MEARGVPGLFFRDTQGCAVSVPVMRPDVPQLGGALAGDVREVAESGSAPRIRTLEPRTQALQVEGVWARIGHAEVGEGGVLAPGPLVSFLTRLGSATCALIAHIPWGRSVGGTDCPDYLDSFPKIGISLAQVDGRGRLGSPDLGLRAGLDRRRDVVVKQGLAVLGSSPGFARTRRQPRCS
jgi:hypothetical protein